MPRIGLLSDSHGWADTTRVGVDILLDHGAQMLLHMGDICGMDVLEALMADNVEAHIVFGNVDWDADSLGRYAKELGITVQDPIGQIELDDGRRINFMHGHDTTGMVRVLSEQPAYLCLGHSHLQRDERIGATRVINPGALFRAAEYSVALLDTDSDELAFHTVEKP